MLPHKAKKVLNVEDKYFSKDRVQISSLKDRVILFLKKFKDLTLTILEILSYLEANALKRVKVFSMGTHLTLKLKPQKRNSIHNKDQR